MAEVGIEDARASERLIDRDIKYSASSTLPFYGSSVLYDVLNSSFFFFFLTSAPSHAQRDVLKWARWPLRTNMFTMLARGAARRKWGREGGGKKGRGRFTLFVFIPPRWIFGDAVWRRFVARCLNSKI